jgi:hypothetical protein
MGRLFAEINCLAANTEQAREAAVRIDLVTADLVLNLNYACPVEQSALRRPQACWKKN